MDLDEHRARIILESSLAAWSRGNIAGSLSHFTDDMIYFSNTGGPDGGPLTIIGKQAYGDLLRKIFDVADGICVAEYYRFNNGVGRAKVECFIRHRETRHTLSGSQRLLVTYRGNRIARLEAYQDAAKTIAFWRMISDEAAIEKALLADHAFS